MGDLTGELDLPLEALGGVAPALGVRAHGLERHSHAELAVLDLVDLSHATAGDEADDAVSGGDQLVAPENGRGLSGGLHRGTYVVRRDPVGR